MTKESLSCKSKKFLFDKNVFDENGFVEGELEEEDLPPTFSEGQLEAAKRESFAKGKKEGLQESLAGRDQYIAQVLEKISKDVSILFESENTREKTYEREAVSLALDLFKKLFPAYNQKFGFEELKETLTDILQKEEGQTEILIEVHPDAVTGIQKHLSAITIHGEKNTKIKVIGNEETGMENCKLTWSDGGAVKNSQLLADKIANLMEEALAAHDRTVHDSVEDRKSGESESSDKPEEVKSGDIE